MAKILCKKCSQSFETFNKETLVNTFVCPHCGWDNATGTPSTPAPAQQPPAAPVTVTQQASQPGQGGPARVMCEWERDWKTNSILAFYNTVSQVFRRPGDYFGTILPFENYLSLTVFIFINHFIAILFSMGFQTLFSAIFTPKEFSGSVPIFICSALFMPFFTTGLTFVIGGILHFCFTMIGGSVKKYSTTMTVYGLGTAASLFGVVPFLGNILAFLYTVIINILGQAKAHEIPPGRAAWSFILPGLVCCCCLFAGVFAIVALAGGIAAFVKDFGGM